MSKILLTIEECSNCLDEMGEHTRLAESQREFERRLSETPGESIEEILNSMKLKICCRNNILSPQYFYMIKVHPAYQCNKEGVIEPCVVPKTEPLPLEFPL